MSNSPDKIIYSMYKVSKNYEKKPVLKDLSLSYFYGAKIGVLGLEALTGQLYPATLLARLVSLEIMHRGTDKAG